MTKLNLFLLLMIKSFFFPKFTGHPSESKEIGALKNALKYNAICKLKG